MEADAVSAVSQWLTEDVGVHGPDHDELLTSMKSHGMPPQPAPQSDGHCMATPPWGRTSDIEPSHCRDSVYEASCRDVPGRLEDYNGYGLLAGGFTSCMLNLLSVSFERGRDPKVAVAHPF